MSAIYKRPISNRLANSDMSLLQVLIVALSIAMYANCYKITWDLSAEVDFEIDAGRSDEVRMSNQFFIYPGTKWCGAGNIADNNSDLGPERDTDKCCRQHDFCPDIIEGFQTGHGLDNPSFYTRLNCECDEEFYKCLKSVNVQSSNQVGQIYFTLLGTQCFKKEYPIKRCDKYTYFPTKKCADYVLDKEGAKKYQWFDVPNYK